MNANDGGSSFWSRRAHHPYLPAWGASSKCVKSVRLRWVKLGVNDTLKGEDSCRNFDLRGVQESQKLGLLPNSELAPLLQKWVPCSNFSEFRATIKLVTCKHTSLQTVVCFHGRSRGSVLCRCIWDRWVAGRGGDIPHLPLDPSLR